MVKRASVAMREKRLASRMFQVVVISIGVNVENLSVNPECV